MKSSLTISGNVLYRDPFLMSNKSKNREYYKSSKYTCATVNTSNNEGVTVTIVVELVVAGHGYHPACTSTQRIEDLSGSI